MQNKTWTRMRRRATGYRSKTSSVDTFFTVPTVGRNHVNYVFHTQQSQRYTFSNKIHQESKEELLVEMNCSHSFNFTVEKQKSL